MTVLVTGASGFIGSHICDHLYRNGYNVLATARDKSRIFGEESERLQFLVLDVLNEASFENILPNISIDAMVHVATSNDILSKNAGDGILLSSVGTRNVLEFCVKRGIAKMIFFSTFQVYGTDLNGVIDERTPTQSENDYGLNHVFGEQYVEMYTRKKNLHGIVVRPSNVYGRFMTPYINRWTLVPGCFCKELFETGHITLRSSGKQTRNFIGLHDISRAVDTLLKVEGKGYSVYNIASDDNLSMLEVAELTKKIFEERYKKEAKIDVLSSSPETGNAFTVNTNKLREAGFEPDKNYSLETEIHKIFDHLDKKNL